MLYLIATPIGNLLDITYRAVNTLRKCGYILCEDTRHSAFLLKEYEIKAPLYSFHQFNEKKMEEKVINDLKQGVEIGLISDAGTPGICDPGEELVKRCYAENLPMTSLPGPCAVITAISLAPFSKLPFQFLGFLPKKSEERKKILANALFYKGMTVFYESPHRLLDTLKQIPHFARICVFRELSKLHEERRCGSTDQLIAYYEQHPPRGECVVAIEPNCPKEEILSITDHVKHIQELFDLPLNEAIKIFADVYGLPKREVYHKIHIDKS